MSSCNDSSTEDGQYGELSRDDVFDTETYSPPDRCDQPDRTVSWRTWVNATGAIRGDFEYDEINDSKDVYFNSYVDPTPASLLFDCPNGNDSDQCYDQECDETRPIEVEYVARHPPGYYEDMYDFREQRPDGNDGFFSSRGDGIMGTVLDIAKAAHPYAAVGISIAEFIANGIDPTEANIRYIGDSNRKRAYWRMDHKGENNSDWTQDICDSSGVEMEIDNARSVGEDIPIQLFSRYTFGLPRYPETQCGCAANNTIVEKQTSYAYVKPTWTSVDQYGNS